MQRIAIARFRGKQVLISGDRLGQAALSIQCIGLPQRRVCVPHGANYTFLTKLNLRLCAMLTALPVLGAAWAACPSTTAILSCTKVPDDTQRLACFDRVAAALSNVHAPAAPPKLTPEQMIGLTRDKVDKLEPPADAPAEPQIKNFTAVFFCVCVGF